MSHQITDPITLNTLTKIRENREDLSETAQALMFEVDAGYSWGSGTCTVIWDQGDGPVSTTYKKLYGTPVN